MTIFAQGIIILSSVLYGVSAFAKNKKLLFIMQIAGSGLYAFYCFFMGAFAGGIMSVMDTLRVVLFYIIEKLNGSQKTKNISGIILLMIGITGTILTWESWISIIPPFGSTLYVISLVVSNLLFIQFSTFFNTVCSSTYLFLSGSTVGAISELIAVVISFSGLLKAIVGHFKEKKSAKSAK